MFETDTFLLVEDDANDVLLVRRAFLKARILNPLRVVKNGEETIAYLLGAEQYSNRVQFPFPSLVLLDIQMPGLDGFQVVRWIRQQERLRSLRVVMLTHSDSMRDVSAAYKLGANSFLIKPVDLDRFVEISQTFGGCWMWATDPNAPVPRSIATEKDSSLDEEIEPPRRPPPVPVIGRVGSS